MVEEIVENNENNGEVMTTESDKKDFASDPEIKEVGDTRKAKQKALAFLRRGKKAHIPNQHLRINQEQFAKVLDPTYIEENSKEYKRVFGKDYNATNSKEFASYIYENADKLLDLSYIVIDGGNGEARRRAGNALLFRLILCDEWGMYQECTNLEHVFQTINIIGDNPHRNDLADQLKKYGVLFISEFYPKLMSAHFETGSFFDEVLVARKYSDKTTIISFSEPLSTNAKIKNRDNGVTLADLSWQLKPSKEVLRIKVGAYESK